ncbi:MAG: hypothetical protein JO316_12965 [Abitibacteriaceae bacterium]|nr:hypothetical protein [Abditibacteriaceae bacterium]
MNNWSSRKWHAVLWMLLLTGTGHMLAQAVSSYLGTWGGRWHDVASGQHGTLRFTVQPNGAFTGTLHNDVNSLSGSWTGSLSDRGLIQADYAYTSGNSGGAGSTKFRAEGTLHRVAPGHLTGRLAFMQGRYQFDAGDFDLLKVGTAAKSSPTPLASTSRSSRRAKRRGAKQRALPSYPAPRSVPLPTPTPPDITITHDPSDPAAPR